MIGATDSSGSDVADTLACVILAHNDPIQLHRLIDALDPFPVFLHCDRRTPSGVFSQMTDGLPDRATVLPRLATPWARWDAVVAEISGYRAALANTDATHIAMMSGSDYPVAPTDRIADYLRSRQGLSIASFEALPRAAWGPDGGMARLRYWHRPFRRHMIRIPIPRRIPGDVVAAGGSVLKVLARHHVESLVAAFDARPDLIAFWRHTWCADETFVPSILNTPAFVPDWADTHIDADLWFIDWLGGGRKSPEWLTEAHLPALRERIRHPAPEPVLFARKFATSTGKGVLNAIDLSMRLAGTVSA